MPKGQLAYITFVDPSGQPIDPGFGQSGGQHPDQGLPPGHSGAHPGHDLPGGGRPTDPGFGGGRPQRPSTWPPQKPSFPPDATDPEWGVGGNGGSHFPIHIPIGGGGGAHADNTLPPVAGHKPVDDPKPGYVWPPLPAGAEPGKAALLLWLQGVGYRYVVVDLDAGVDNTLPGGGARPGTLPGQTPEPKR